MKQKEITSKVHSALDNFYANNIYLIENNLCERCLLHRLAVCIENESFPNYFVDCEYNKSHINEQASLKVVSNIKGNYIDILIRKRSSNPIDDLACFEVKRYSNYSGRDKDRENLRILTAGSQFGYRYGFYIILGKTRESSIIELYVKGDLFRTSTSGNLST